MPAAYIEQEMGSGVMAFFLQGAPGDINPYYEQDSVDRRCDWP